MPPPARAVHLWLLRLLTAAGLAVDAYVHADLAADRDLVGDDISQGTLFRIEAGAASFAALLVLLAATRVTWAIAFLVAASALGALLLYTYVDVGALGPLPNMYEPVWYREKTIAAVAEGVAVVTALLGLAAVGRGSGRHRR
ncbi:hypothetical protein ACFVHB_15765 [Kitasatospora sp. NPDC127111]|uniref:hypothetical protein n=1 Tax=Kitasatospora sp. NPDC127111 TaxID=3345363 RepID=UPI0036262F75